ncbi:M28 family metallopeptidase [Sporobolomyces salmoneus]|uniref:M28 family metallopeptidase n=1 Tax=Sporobolomyces salmoneus TaxID=183962 RepID=UPI0031766446
MDRPKPPLDPEKAYQTPPPTGVSPQQARIARIAVRYRLLIILLALSLWSISYYYSPFPRFSHDLFARGRPALDRFDDGYSHSHFLWGNPSSPSPSSSVGRTSPELLKEFLKIPSAQSAKNISKSFTRETHIAGTEGDYKSALRVKNQWEELLGLEQTGEKENLFDAGTKEDREALMGKPHEHRRGGCHGRGRRGHWRMKTRKWVRKLRRFFLSSSLSHSHHYSRKHHHHGHSLPSTPRVWISTYYPYLNYPLSHSLTLTPPNSSSGPSFVASLTESSFPSEDPTSPNGVPTFHGFSKSGTAKGKLVYATRGTKEDFERLEKEGVEVKGKVVLVQYGGSFRGLKVKAAEEAGAVGCIIYSDPAADGEITEENGFKPYPFGPARAPSSVQRGSVQYLSIRPGDPLTPSLPAYNPSLPSSPSRLPLDSSSLPIPSIPSLPISYEDAIPLLKSLNGKGLKREDKEGWKEGGLRYKGVEYWTGPGDEMVELVNRMDDKVTTKIWNTMALIPGHITDEIVVLGNHNDAWTFGAGDPNSGTSSLHETLKGFSHLLKQGWKPKRSILVASWDAEEYGLIGSTEFGEDFTGWLREKVVAYLNLDVSVSGSSFELAASPSLAHLLQECSSLVRDPTSPSNSTSTTTSSKDLIAVEGGELEKRTSTKGQEDLGQTKVKTLGSGSDFSVFLQYIGIASGNLGYSGAKGDPVYHYHSNFDSFAWMEKFGDPTFERHVVVSKILGLTALRLVDDLVLPLNTTAYALELEKYLQKVVSLPSYPGREQLDLTLLGSKLATLVQVSLKLDQHASSLVSRVSSLQAQLISPSRHHKHRGGKKHKKEMKRLLKEIRKVNKQKQSFESTLLVPPGEPGLPGREWYKSLVVAPGRWLGYGATTFPGLTEALELDGDVESARKEMERLEKSIDRAVRLLKI